MTSEGGVRPLRHTMAPLLGLLLVRVALDLARIFAEPRRYINHEEAYNASVGLLLWHGGLWDELLALQYKGFCGGCTVVSVVSAPWLGVLGDHFLAWKALAVLWSLATMCVAFVALDRVAGRGAAWAGLVLLAVPIPGLADVDLMLWGNHRESALWVLGAVALIAGGRPVWGALICGLALWFGRTSIYGAAVLIPLVMWGAPSWRDRGKRGLAFFVGMAPMLLPAAGGDAGFYELGLVDNLLSHGPLGALERLWGLVGGAPYRLLPGWGSAVGAAVLLAGGAAGAVLCLVRRRGRVLVVLALVFAVAFALSGFPIPLGRPGSPVVNLRYFAPWMLWLSLLTAAGAGPLLERAGWRRWAGGCLVALPLLVAGIGHVRGGLREMPEGLAGRLAVYDGPQLALVGAHRLKDVRGRSSSEPQVERTLRLMDGVQLAWSGTEPEAAVGAARGADVLHGLGEALVGEPWSDAQIAEANRWLSQLEPERAKALGRGMAATVGFDLAGERGNGSPARQVEALLERLSAGSEGACWLCSAAGSVAAVRCEAFDEAFDAAVFERCVGRAAGRGVHRDEVLYGVGLTSQRAWRDPELNAALVEGLGAGFLEGLSSPSAGMSAPKRREAFRRKSSRRGE